MFYVNENIDKACSLTELSEDELEVVVGRFSAVSSRKGLLRGKVIVMIDGNVQIRKCFGNKLLWEKHG